MSLKDTLLNAIHEFEAKLRGDEPALEAQAAQAVEELKADAVKIIDEHEAAAPAAEEAPPAA